MPARRRWTEAEKELVLSLVKEGRPYSSITQLVGPGKATINRWVKNPQIVTGSGYTCILTKHQEELLVKTCVYAADCGFAFGRFFLGQLVCSLCADLRIPNPFKDGVPGEKW